MLIRFPGLARALLLLGLLTSAALAGPMEDGAAAYRRKDYKAATSIWRPLAEKGSGVKADPNEALKWYSKAAAQGQAEAQTNLASIYEDRLDWVKFYRLAADQGVVQAHKWLTLASLRGVMGLAQKDCERVAGNLTPAQLEESGRLVREWQARHP